MMTTNNIPRSLKPKNMMANGTHAMLGNVSRPTANELIVLPKPRNLTMASPVATPMPSEITKPAPSLANVVPIPSGNEESSTRSPIAATTIAGEGNRNVGQIPRRNTSCHIPTNAARNSATLAASLTSKLRLLDCFRARFSSSKLEVLHKFVQYHAYSILVDRDLGPLS